jgi:hypothetical protein
MMSSTSDSDSSGVSQNQLEDDSEGRAVLGCCCTWAASAPYAVNSVAIQYRKYC